MTVGRWAPATPATAASEVWSLLSDLSFELAHPHFEAAAAEFDLAPTQAMALTELARRSPVSMRELARVLRCDPSNVTGVTDRLEGRGLVERRADPRDRRVKTLALTPAGADVSRQLAARLSSPPDVIIALPEPDQARLRD